MPTQLSTPTTAFARLGSPREFATDPSDNVDLEDTSATRETHVTFSCLRRSALPLLCMAGLIVGILAAVGTFSGSGESISTGTSSTPAPTTHTPTTLSPSPTTKPTTVTPTPTLANGLCPLRGMYLSGTSCVACPTPKKTFSVFWESQVDCSTFATSSAAAYVTHIYWSFALIDPTTGTVSSTFQGSSATLKACIAAARAKCIKNYVSIGGATMRQTFVALNSSAQLTTFALSAAQVVQEYGFDGVDIDDESGNLLAGGDWKANALPNVLVYLQGLKTQLAALPRAATEPKYQITWDEFPTSLSTGCDLASGDYLRCFDVRIANIVDQVNIMMYNSASSTDYDNFLNVVTPTEWATAMPASKIVIGGCVGPIGTIGGCAFGAAPTATQLKAYASVGASKYGGTMLWTGSADANTANGATMVAMGVAGGYSAT
ncbi:carbohydrate-binding protein [Achlya hypogyna]|uniref:Carbohydrate-binding protein n=1 Tax=Achlya hypogyna TaxID=1202772 RepID=A0A1V9Z4T4_ACHHY|nr:carbohydrate-binding protein [Achlya hypogyna]